MSKGQPAVPRCDLPRSWRLPWLPLARGLDGGEEAPLPRRVAQRQSLGRQSNRRWVSGYLIGGSLRRYTLQGPSKVRFQGSVSFAIPLGQDARTRSDITEGTGTT